VKDRTNIVKWSLGIPIRYTGSTCLPRAVREVREVGDSHEDVSESPVEGQPRVGEARGGSVRCQRSPWRVIYHTLDVKLF
jgi:hypothetical protein